MIDKDLYGILRWIVETHVRVDAFASHMCERKCSFCAIDLGWIDIYCCAVYCYLIEQQSTHERTIAFILQHLFCKLVAKLTKPSFTLLCLNAHQDISAHYNNAYSIWHAHWNEQKKIASAQMKHSFSLWMRIKDASIQRRRNKKWLRNQTMGVNSMLDSAQHT